MLARADSLGIPGLSSPAPTASPVAFPAWARAEKPPENQAEAAFYAGAALSRLDAIVRDNPPWAGAIRQRLALRAAVACLTRSGRAEGEGALRDAVQFTAPGADPGPAGRRLLAWRALVSGSIAQWRGAIGVAAEALGAPRDDALQAAIEAAELCAGGALSAPFAAAKTFTLVSHALNPGAGPRPGGRGGEGELLASWLSDAVLAQTLHWSFALPLLASGLHSAGGWRTAGNAGEVAETTRILFAYAQAAAQACDCAAELGRRAQRLNEVTPKLRAKAAGAAVGALLDEDSLSAATPIKGLSERGARRLFERLAALGAIRELTGRKSFRLYGL